MSAFEVYKLFLALKQHFSTTNQYDFFKYHGKVKANSESSRYKRDHHFYEKISRKYNQKEMLGFFVSNLIKNPDLWIGDLCKQHDVHKRVYLDWKSKKESFTYSFKTEAAHIKEQESNFDVLFECNESQHPKLVDLYTEGEISLETLIGVDLVVDCFAHWNRSMSEDIIWKDLYHICKQYSPFLGYDDNTKIKFRNILKKEYLDV